MINIILEVDTNHKNKTNRYLNCFKLEVMNIIIVLIVLSLIIALCFLILFIWAVKSGQYDDSYTPSIRILLDDNNTDKND